jgi:hypothetical protein
MKALAHDEADRPSEIRAEIVLPRGAKIVAAPRSTSQRTILNTHGITPRCFLERVVPALRAAGVPVANIGKLRVVAVEDLDSWLRAQGDDMPPVPRRGKLRAPTDDVDEVEEILAQHGTRRIGAAR